MVTVGPQAYRGDAIAGGALELRAALDAARNRLDGNLSDRLDDPQAEFDRIPLDGPAAPLARSLVAFATDDESRRTEVVDLLGKAASTSRTRHHPATRLDTPRQPLHASGMDDTIHRAGSGEPLLLLHGITCSWHVWQPVLPALEVEYDVTALTLPGHLGRPWPHDRPPSIDSLVDLLEEQLDDLGLDRPHLIGNSLGGWASILLAERGRAGTVLAISPAGGFTADEQRVPALFRAMRRNIEEARPHAEELLADPADRADLFAIVCEHGDRIALDDAVRWWDAVLAVDRLEEALTALLSATLPRVRGETPVTIAWAEHDRLIPEDDYAAGWRGAAPGATWTTLPGVGHVPMWDDPGLLVAAIRESTARG